MKKTIITSADLLWFHPLAIAATSLILVLLSISLSAQVMDSTFGTPSQTYGNNSLGLSISDFPDTKDQAFSALHLPDGRIILAGYTRGTSENDFALVRLMPDGQGDPLMGPDGQLRLDLGYPNDSCLVAALYGEEHLLMGGCVAPPGTDHYVNLLVKTDIDGKIDSTFGVQGKVLIDLPTQREMITKIVPLPDGKILLAGNVFNGASVLFYSDSSRVFLCRLHPDGQIDSTFGTDGFVFQRWEDACTISVLGDISIDGNGSIVITGASYDPIIGEYNGTSLCSHKITLCRYHSDGTPDSTFGTAGKVQLPTGYGRGNALLHYPDGRILVAGASGWVSGDPHVTYVARLLPNGLFDKNFAEDGRLETQTLFFNINDAGTGDPIGIVRLPGRIVVGVQFSLWSSRSGFGALALTEEGEIDYSFGNDGKFVVHPQYSLHMFVNQITSTGDDHFYLSGYYNLVLPNRMIIAKVLVPSGSSTTGGPEPGKVVVFPNPVQRGNSVQVDMKNTGLYASEGALVLYNAYGREVLTQRFSHGTEALQVATSGLSSGVYFGYLKGEKARHLVRIVVSE